MGNVCGVCDVSDRAPEVLPEKNGGPGVVLEEEKKDDPGGEAVKQLRGLMGRLDEQIEEKKKRQEEVLANCTYTNTPTETYHFKTCKVIKVYDGDTFWVAADHRGRLERFSIRLWGVDAYELRGEKDPGLKQKGADAKAFVEDQLLDKIIKVDILNGRRVDGKIVREKYGRLLSKITLGDGRDLGETLCQMGLGYPYGGGNKAEARDKV
jgi:endonuclease YncB( thermonuclease family)